MKADQPGFDQSGLSFVLSHFLLPRAFSPASLKNTGKYTLPIRPAFQSLFGVRKNYYRRQLDLDTCVRIIGEVLIRAEIQFTSSRPATRKLRVVVLPPPRPALALANKGILGLASGPSSQSD